MTKKVAFILTAVCIMVTATIVGFAVNSQPSQETITYTGISKSQMTAVDYKNKETESDLVLTPEGSEETLEELLSSGETSETVVLNV